MNRIVRFALDLYPSQIRLFPLDHLFWSATNIFNGLDDDYTVTSSSSKVKSRSSRSHSTSSKSKSKSSKTSSGKGKAPVQEDIPEDDEQPYDDRYAQRKAPEPQTESMCKFLPGPVVYPQRSFS